MSSIGPQLPPHLAKRKRSPEDESPDLPPAKTPKANQDEIALEDGDDDSDDGYGPSAPKPPTAAAPARPSTGPTLPPAVPASNAHEIALDSGSDNDDDTGPAPPPAAPAPRRVMGPAPPPADLAERPSAGPEAETGSDSDGSSDDDYGPALPGATRPSIGPSLPTASFGDGAAASGPARPKRDDWMLAPPTSEGYRERDPTKIRSRKFASGAGATSRPRDGAGGVSSIWTETPEEKAKRLADAVLGRGGGGGVSEVPAAAAASSKRGGGGSGAREQQDKIRALTEQMRGRSLYDEHQSSKKAGKDAGKDAAGKGGGDDEDDDPSKRAFDREKDMGLGMKITASQRKELLNRAADFGGRFQKGNYL